MSALPALVLAIAITYLIIDFLKAYLPSPLLWVIGIAVCYALFKISHRFLKSLKE